MLSVVSRTFMSTRWMLKSITQHVPALGESITEGTIARWLKSPGETVSIDEVICVVETDKVTVDIKSEFSGTFLKRIASDSVAVGAPLFEINSETTGISTPQSVTAPVSSAAPIVPRAVEHGSRRPLIKFVGKRTKSVKLLEPTGSPVAVPIISISNAGKKSGNGIEFLALGDGAFLGRPKLSSIEIEAVLSGGANIV